MFQEVREINNWGQNIMNGFTKVRDKGNEISDH